MLGSIDVYLMRNLIKSNSDVNLPQNNGFKISKQRLKRFGCCYTCFRLEKKFTYDHKIAFSQIHEFFQ